MGMLTIVAFVIGGFFIWTVWGFLKYKQMERMDKNEITSYLRDGLSLHEALKRAFSNLNKFKHLGLQEATVEKVSDGIAGLEKMMSAGNVVEIYSSFIHRYIYRNGKYKTPHNLSDQKIVYAIQALGLQERNGYYVIKPDEGVEIDKKYPD
jgi:hypothetical protein